jgi:hypothetical protein
LTFHVSLTGLSPFIALLSSRLQVSWLSQTRVQTPHLHFLSEWIRFVLFPFQSPLLGESRFLSFPAVTKMLQFTASAILTDNLRRDEKSHSRTPGSMAACAYPRFIAACHTLHRFPSQAIHHTAYLTLFSRNDSPMKSSWNSIGVHILTSAPNANGHLPRIITNLFHHSTIVHPPSLTESFIFLEIELHRMRYHGLPRFRYKPLSRHRKMIYSE